MRHTKHYWRAAFLIVGAFLAFLVLRAFLIPASFEKYGFYRWDNVQEQMDQPISFGAKDACKDCHDKIYETHGQGKHQTVQCQNCHAPLTTHIKKGEIVGDMVINRSPKLCLRCHRKLEARPTDFPQIDVKEHLHELEGNLQQGVCLECHQPHNPSF